MASTGTQKGKLRQRLLNSELDINVLNEQQQPQMPMQQMPMGQGGGVYQQQYPQAYPQAYGANVANGPQGPQGPQSQPSFPNSYESLTNQSANDGVRKASLTSQSNMTMNKFFRRNKGDGGFDEDMGADINDLTNGSNVSFDDISHIRDRGKYGVNGPHLDSTPFIPTIGGGIGSASGKSINNIQYRKQMNHQKKMAFASSARAMSLAGSNPMQQPSDPRAMSLSSFGNGSGPRAMSLNSNGMMANGPRAMSLNNRMPMPPPGKGGYMPQNGPRTMSMRNNGAQFGNGPYMQPTGGPRAMSLTNGPPGPRAMSLTNGNPMNQQYPPQPHPQQVQQMQQLNPQQMQHMQQMQQMQHMQHMQQMQQLNPQQYGGYQAMNPNARAMSLNGGNPMNDPRFNQAGGQFNNSQQIQNMPHLMPNGPNPNTTLGPNQNYAQKSNDSLMNVVEEEDENNTNSPKENQVVSSNRKENYANNTNDDNTNDDDMVYQFDEHDDAGLLSRKSTLKKSNSMKLRKLNLFNSETREQPDIQETSFDESPNESRRLSHSSQTLYNTDNDVSPSFNLRNARGARESTLNDASNEEDLVQRDERQEKFRSLGANAEYNGSNANSLNKDVFVTANDLVSPSKIDEANNSNKKSSPLKNTDYEDINENEENYMKNNDMLKGRGSPEPISNSKLPNNTHTNTLSKQPSIRSLVTNTAFDKFRDTPTKSSKTLPELPVSPANSDYGTNATNITNEDLNLEGSFSQPKPMLDETSNYSSLSSFTQSQNNANPTTFERTNINAGPSASQQASDQSISTTPRDYNENTTPPTTHNSNISNTNYNDKAQTVHSNVAHGYPKVEGKDPSNERRMSAIRNMNTSDMLSSPIVDGNTFTPESAKKERRSSRTFSLSNKSKNIFKRFSKSGKKAADEDESFTNDDVSFNLNRNSIHSYNQGGIQNRKASSASIGQPRPEKPLKFTKEELGIMNCNNELLNELQLVTTELASSIKRELEFANRLKNNSSSPLESSDELQSQLLGKAKVISDLQDKLNKERSLRFICEEHALLAENGTSPSPLKLNYEKTELYKQLLIKNDLVNQLQDKIEESQMRQSTGDNNLLMKYNELLEENTDLKSTVIPELENRIEASRNVSSLNNNKLLNLVNNYTDHGNTNSRGDYEEDYYDDEYDQSREHIEISTLKNQREELREVVSKLSSSYNYELKLAQEKIKNLELKVQDMNSINNKLSQRLESNRTISGGQNNHNNTSNSPLNILNNNKGGKLQGFAIVSPTKKLFDD